MKEYTYEELRNKEVVHYDFFTKNYNGTAAFLDGILISVYIAKRWRSRRITLQSWSPYEEYLGLYNEGRYSIHAIGRYARMYGQKRVTLGDGWKYLMPTEKGLYPLE